MAVVENDENAASGSLPVIEKLVGYRNFVRSNPRSDKFKVNNFHHIEWWCSDATNCSKRFAYGLGMSVVARSDISTGNSAFSSHVMQSNDVIFAFTAPYATRLAGPPGETPMPWYNNSQAFRFIEDHGLAVRAIGVSVEDVGVAFEAATSNGGIAVKSPVTLQDDTTGQQLTVAEVQLYGDVVLRLVNGDFKGPFLPNYRPVGSLTRTSYGIQRIDHTPGNSYNLLETANYIARMTGFHPFFQVVAEDVGTDTSGLNSIVLASNNEAVMLPINEPVYGTKRKSQIQTQLEQNGGPHVQHLALITDDIFATLREMMSRSEAGGFEFMPPASESYYKALPDRVGGTLSDDQMRQVKELGILVDKTSDGVLLQIFTKPVGDRPTIFLEIIQRICESVDEPEEAPAGCGGFGNGNFQELFRAYENFEKTLKV